MQFKTLAFLSILSILLFTGCDSKDKNEDSKETTTQKVNKITEFQLKTTNDGIINLKLDKDKIILKDYPNKIVLLNFFATWCPPCKAEIPNLVRLQNDYKNDFVVISVLLEEMKTNEELKAFMKDFEINYEVVNSPDGFDLARNLGGIKSIPTMYLIDKNSAVFQKYVGLVPSEMLEVDIKKVLER
ncbi:protein disulfide reductase, TlpA family [Arcobacter venerupis]|uniref:Protein disulfide reductase, TlpA family n=1 Tax=Arcobacter venerupis TaxID=1054033 RepID=A0AAE7B9G0_9BACT|nr:TlpA disulfide reductase family protein [Arcobacter venerupis]QKF67561.1 protein disulfide reductase, TlpA family [Arcobacter venerupis]RWS50429.1 thioredoxin [Arcobacter venerupis]